MSADEKLAALLRDPAIRRLMKVARDAGGELRIVGGAVRDALLKLPAGEIDLASTLPPQTLMKALREDGVKTVPTGIEFGTITAVIGGHGFEITTLRHDVETDGRHATVAFTDDWRADASRRDFTINALYLDADGKLYDYFDGELDLKNAHIRFIGDAGARIREDVLRIFRFFRFSACYGHGALDALGLQACAENAGLIPQLPVERIWRELGKLLAAKDPISAWQGMIDAKVLPRVMPEAVYMGCLVGLVAVEKRYGIPPTTLRHLAALFPAQESIANQIGRKLKLSKRDAQKLNLLATLPPLLVSRLDRIAFRRALYQYGVEDARDGALLLAAAQPSLNISEALKAAAEWKKPVFPLQGQDLFQFGLKPGPALGLVLQKVEQEWITADFKPNHEQCLALAQKNLPT